MYHPAQGHRFESGADAEVRVCVCPCCVVNSMEVGCSLETDREDIWLVHSQQRNLARREGKSLFTGMQQTLHVGGNDTAQLQALKEEGHWEGNSICVNFLNFVSSLRGLA